MNLVSAFKKLRFEEQLTEEEKNSLVLFTDRFISCSLNPNLMTQEVIDIVKEVNIHRCTTKCQYQCKYSFPKYPLKETIFIDKNEPLPAEDKDENSEVILTNVNNILKDDDKLAEIQQKYPNKGTTKEANDVLRSKRIETMLKMAGNIKYQDYVMAIKRSKRYGSTVLLQRDLDEVYVNNYNKEWITNWNANLDIQLVPDMFGVVTYVTDYWLKPDKGMTEKLEKSAKDLRSEPEMRKRCQQLANIFLTHRQMGESEAYYKILPHLTLKYSNIATIFVPTDIKEKRSKFLMKLDKDDPNSKNGVQVKGGREGTFLEKPDIIERYCRRDLENHPELEFLTLSQFAIMYEPIT